jgi:molybdate transport system ATP-binding protein
MSLTVDIEKRLGDFHLRAGFDCADGVTGLLGPSGCGKSLTLKCIAGIERPDRGRIELDGRVLFDSERRIDLKPRERRVGYLFQNYALFPNMTVRQNLLCGLCHERDGVRREKALDEALALFGLRELEDRRPGQLSGGQQQRVALARALVNRPALLLLDEPFSALDAHLRLKLQIAMLDALREYGRPALMVTHDRNEAYRMCDRIAVMSEGVAQMPMQTKRLFADPGTVSAASLTGCKNITPARRVGENLLHAPAWGVTLETALPLSDDVTHVGIRAHYFGQRVPQNRFPVVFVGDMEEPFEWVLAFRYAGQAPDAPPLWWRIPKEKRPRPLPEALGIAPVNVLPLRG